MSLAATVLLAILLLIAVGLVLRGLNKRHRPEADIETLWRDALAAQEDVEAKLVALEKVRSESALAPDDDAAVVEIEHRLYLAELDFTEAVRHFKVLAIRFRRAVAERLAGNPQAEALLEQMAAAERSLPEGL